MNIIRPGNPNKPKDVKMFSCENCGCVFEADNREYAYADQLESMHDGIVAKCKCPTCWKTAYLYR